MTKIVVSDGSGAADEFDANGPLARLLAGELTRAIQTAIALQTEIPWLVRVESAEGIERLVIPMPLDPDWDRKNSMVSRIVDFCVMRQASSVVLGLMLVRPKPHILCAAHVRGNKQECIAWFRKDKRPWTDESFSAIQLQPKGYLGAVLDGYFTLLPTELTLPEKRKKGVVQWFGTTGLYPPRQIPGE